MFDRFKIKVIFLFSKLDLTSWSQCAFHIYSVSLVCEGVPSNVSCLLFLGHLNTQFLKNKLLLSSTNHVPPKKKKKISVPLWIGIIIPLL